MSKLEAADVQACLTAAAHNRLDRLECFSSVASTNTHLMSQRAPAPGHYRVAIANHQTSGRGRHYRRWVSPPGSGLYLSLAYTFAAAQRDLPALTLAIGVSVIDAFSQLGIEDVSLKWPNDIVARDSKLGGILTEVQAGLPSRTTVVTGIGINVDLSGQADMGARSDWAQQAIDLRSLTGAVPQHAVLAGTVIECLLAALLRFESTGFAGFVHEWRRYDWLRGRHIVVDQAERKLSGIAAGVDDDGALLLDTDAGRTRVISGSIAIADTVGSLA